MNKAEFTKFFAYITAATNDTNPSKAKVQVYWDALNDLTFDVAMIAAKKIIATLENPFLPMPAVFRRVAAEITQPKIKTAGEAYEEVLLAIRKFGSYKEQEALESLDSLTAKVVRAVGWKSLCLSEEPDIVRAQFRKAYEAMQIRAEEEIKMPETLKDAIGMISDKAKIPGTPVVENLAGAKERLLAELEKEFEE